MYYKTFFGPTEPDRTGIMYQAIHKCKLVVNILVLTSLYCLANSCRAIVLRRVCQFDFLKLKYSSVTSVVYSIEAIILVTYCCTNMYFYSDNMSCVLVWRSNREELITRKTVIKRETTRMVNKVNSWSEYAGFNASVYTEKATQLNNNCTEILPAFLSVCSENKFMVYNAEITGT